MRLFTKYCLGVSLCLLSACFDVYSQDTPPAEPTQISNPDHLPVLKLKNQQIPIETACTPAEQQKGLMFRESMPANQGMLFVFNSERTLSFWMKNTLLPLSIAYIDSKGMIVDIQNMQPKNETPHPSKKPAQYALEMNQGWFKANLIQVGDSITLDNFCSNP